MMALQVENIIWDWNGTLLDDLHVCLEGINILLNRRGLPQINEHKYKEIFTFPIRLHYEAAGFDFSKEPFEVPAEEFIREYEKLSHRTSLFPDVIDALTFFKEKGIRQFVLSAMEERALRTTLTSLGIYHYFTGIYGIADNFAVSKIDRGRELVRKFGLDHYNAILVGDTLHDAEVADELGLQVILLGRGHQHPGRLVSKGVPVKNSLEDIKEILN